MAQLSYPGVYIQEVPSGSRTITGVSTSVTAFIGMASRGPLNDPTLVLSYADYVRVFSDDTSQGEMTDQVRQFFLNGGSQAYITRIAEGAPANSTFTQGDLTLTAKSPGTHGDAIHFTIDAVDSNIFDLTVYRLAAAPGGVEVATDVEVFAGVTIDGDNGGRAVEVAVNGVSIHVSASASGTTQPTEVEDQALAGGNDGSEPTDVATYDAAFLAIEEQVDLINLIVLPRYASNPVFDEAVNTASGIAQKWRAFFIHDLPARDGSIEDTVTAIDNARLGVVKDHTAVYWPGLKINPDNNPRTIDPSGSIAGLMARTDANRGVWKAPAGLEASILGAQGVSRPLSDEQNGILNPKALNAIRVFPNGIVSWGARTLDGFDNSGNDDFKYVPVRRFQLMIEESLYRGLKFAVFEPNDEPLWQQIRLAAGSFMNGLFRQGAFAGKTARDAYFVKVDSETTTQNDINLGIVNVLVGFAPLKPAEFIVVKIQQKAGEVQV